MKKLLSFILLTCLFAAPAAATIVGLQAADGGTCEVDSATLNSHLVDNALRLAQGSETVAVPVAPTRAILQQALDVHNAKQTSDLKSLVAQVPSSELVQILNTYEFLFGQTDWQANARFFNRFQSPDVNFTFFAHAILDKIVHELGAQPLVEHNPHSFMSEVDKNDTVLWRFIEHRFQSDVVNNSPWQYQSLSRPDGHIENVWSSAWSPDGQTLATAGDHTVKLWHANGTLVATLGALDGHTGQIRTLAWSPDGQILATSSYDHTVKLWHANGTLVATLGGHDGHTDVVWSLTWSPDGQILATGSWDRTAKLWHANGTLVATLGGPVSSVAWSPDGQTLATGSDDHTAKLWRPDGTLIATLGGQDDPADQIYFFVWSPDGQILATGSEDHTIKLRHVNGTLVATIGGQDDHANQIYCFASSFDVWSPDGQTLANGSEGHTIKLCHANGSPITTLDTTSRIFSVKWSPDGQTLATGLDDNTVRLWRADGMLISTLGQHSARYNPIWSLAWSPDGQILAASSLDSTVKLWRPNGALICILDGSNDNRRSIDSLTWSPDGQMLARSEDCRVKFWRHMAPAHANLSMLQKLLLLKFARQKTLTPDELENLQPLIDTLPELAAAFIAQCAEQQA